MLAEAGEAGVARRALEADPADWCASIRSRVMESKFNKIPLIILAGSAKKGEAVTGEDSHRLYGPKGLKIQLAGRPLIDVIVDRFRSSGAFDPIFIAGPANRYGATRGSAEVIDTDADFGRNIRAAMESVVARLSPGAAMFTTCDVIPEPAELDALVADYQKHAPLDFWFPLIRVPKDRAELGASGQKRRYLVIPDGVTEPVPVLPSHMVMVDPRALRLTLLYKCFQLAYRSRTRPVGARFLYISSGVLYFLVKRDVENLFKLKPPLLTLMALFNAALLSHRVGRGSITQRQVETHMHQVFGNEPHRRKYRERTGRVPILDGLSLALDIDTEEEARELALEISGS